MKIDEFEKGLYTGIFLCWALSSMYLAYTCDLHFKENSGYFDYAICYNWIK